MRGETRVSVRWREFGGRSLEGMALPQACAHQFPVGRSSPSAATRIFILLTVTLQHFREGPLAGQGQMEALHHLSARGRMRPNFICATCEGQYGGVRNEVTDIM